LALIGQGKVVEGIGRMSEATRHQPAHADANYRIGLALLRNMKRPEQALNRFKASSRSRPDDPDTHYQMAHCYKMLGQPEEAIAEFREALRLRPDWDNPLNDLAWLLATNPDAKYRNGAEAAALARRALEINQRETPMILDSLAAAEAEGGRFDDALKYQRQAIELAKARGLDALAKELETRIDPYRQGKAWRQAAPATTQPAAEAGTR
jgi:tetratricopeptide (TPR) repeat protein